MEKIIADIVTRSVTSIETDVFGSVLMVNLWQTCTLWNSDITALFAQKEQ